jgi:hypothetical protein
VKLINEKKRVNNIAGSFGIIIVILAATLTIDTDQAETGKREDTFKVIMTIFKADKSKGDVVAIVTSNNGEASRVKFLDAGSPPKLPNPTALTPSVTSPGTNGGIWNTWRPFQILL